MKSSKTGKTGKMMMQMTKKGTYHKKKVGLAIAVVAITFGASSYQPAFAAEVNEKTDNKYAGYNSSSASSTQRSGNQLQLESEKNRRGKDTVLDFTILRDSGYAIKQLKELAIHIFDECTRLEPVLTDCREATGSTEITSSDIDSNKKYLKPRSAWIFFYIATFEPIMQLFRADTQTNSQETGKLLVPEDIAPRMNSEWAKLDKSIAEVDGEIDKLSQLLDDDPDNSVEMATSALKIYEKTLEMEKVRQELYIMLQQSKIKGVKKLVAI